MAGPLDGVRVIDMTSNFMGPYASLLLADLGADICKLESPLGDTTRHVGPARNEGMSVIFLHLNRNKRSIVLDLKKAEGLEALKRMLASADVLLHSFRPKTMAKLGLDYDSLRKINSRLVYCGCFGFGQNGPYADRPAYDDLIQAGTGMPLLQARRTGEPSYVASAIADRIVGMATSNAVSAALYRREKSGEGQSVEVPMFETFAHFVMGDHMYGLTFDPPIGDWGYARMMSSDRRPYRTRDGYIGVNVYTDRHWRRFFELSGHPDMATDPRYATIFGRTQHINELYRFLSDVFEARSSDEWVEALLAADIPVIKMNTPATLLEDPHMQAVGFFQFQDHPTEGRIRTIGIPQQWSSSAPEQRYPSPQLGEHTAVLLGEYGFSSAEIAQLIGVGAAQSAAPAQTSAAFTQSA